MREKGNKSSKLNVGTSVMVDPRFEHVRKDPRFGRPRKKDVKIKLDYRFAQMLENEEFSEKRKYFCNSFNFTDRSEDLY